MDFDAILAELKKAYPKARGAKRYELLFTALGCCGPVRPLPEWLFEALMRTLAAHKQPKNPVRERWTLARAFLDGGDPALKQQWERWKAAGQLTEEEKTWDWTQPPLKWEEVWPRVSEILTTAGRPAKPETVRKSYDLIERSLPKAQRRPRTYRRRH